MEWWMTIALDLKLSSPGPTVYKEFVENALREMRPDECAIKDARDGGLGWRGLTYKSRFLDCGTRRPTNRGVGKNRVAPLGMTGW